MSKGRGKTKFPDEKGVDRVFDTEKLKRYYNAFTGYGARTQLINTVAEKAGYSIEAVKSWIKGDNGPGSLEAIHILEEYFDLPKNSLLKYEEEEKKEMENTRTIGKTEKKAARKLYKKMNEMICSIRYHYGDNGYYDQLTEKTDLKDIADAIRGKGRVRFPRDYTDECILAIRKTAIDLPEKVRNACLDLVYDTLGRSMIISEKVQAIFNCEDVTTLNLEDLKLNPDGDYITYSTGFPRFETEGFNAYIKKLCALKKPGVKYEDPTNGEEDRVIYSALQIEKLYEKLDEIFKDYIVK